MCSHHVIGDTCLLVLSLRGAAGDVAISLALTSDSCLLVSKRDYRAAEVDFLSSRQGVMASGTSRMPRSQSEQ
jgi:hypothetical protein